LNLSRRLFWSFVIVLLASVFCRQSALAELRTVSFPADKRYGHLVLMNYAPNRPTADHLDRLTPHDIILGYAQGKTRVNIPPGGICCFDPSPGLYINPRPIATIDAAGIDGIKLTYSGLEDGEEKICDNFASYVKHFSALKLIRCKGSSLTDVGLESMAPLSNVVCLDLSNTYVSKKAVALACRYPKLEMLILSNVDLHGADFARLAALPHLGCLALHNCNLVDGDIKALSSCKHIFNLDISKNMRLTSASLPSIKNMKELEILFVDTTSIRPADLPTIKELPLRVLNFDSGRVNQATAKNLLAAFPILNKRYGILFPHLHKTVTSEEKMIFAPTK